MFSPLEEIFFWSAIMRDHAEFLYNALAPSEKDLIEQTLYFQAQFKEVREQAEKLIEINDIEASSLINRVIPLLKEFLDFKQLIITKQINCDILISFTPTFVNHMLNEAQEFYRNLFMSFSNNTQDEIQSTLALHKIWLRDASGHATSIIANLDGVEDMLIKEAQEFKKKFDQLFIKSFELDQILERSLKPNYRVLNHFAKQVEDTMIDFINFLDRIKNLRKDCQILGAIHPSIPDHMIREESYYLTKLKKIRID